MKPRIVVVAACVLGLLALPLAAQETPKSLVAAYDSLADTILALRAAEAGFVKALLDGHRHAAEVLAHRGDWEGAAAEVALFANEGDNAVAGVRKRLLEGGHHHNSAAEEQGVFEEGYVIVTREAKKKLLMVSAELRQADEAGKKEAWKTFAKIAAELLAMEE
jgi:hypothetical protein